MRRRSFLRLAGAAVLGVLASKVPVFAEELPSYGRSMRGLGYLINERGAILFAPGTVPGSMFDYCVLRLREFNELTSTIAVESLPPWADSTCRIGSGD